MNNTQTTTYKLGVAVVRLHNPKRNLEATERVLITADKYQEWAERQAAERLINPWEWVVITSIIEPR